MYPEPKVAIIARTPNARSQTFVQRHFRHLCNGNTAVVSNRDYPEGVEGKPFHVYRRSRVEAFLRSRGLDPLGIAGGWQKRNIAALKAFLDAEKVTHVLLEFGYVATDFGPAIRQTGRPVHCMFRGNDASSRLNNAIYRRLLAQTLPSLDGIIAVSAHLIANLKDAGLDVPRSIVVPSGVDVERFVPGNAEPGLLISVGRLVAKKSPELLVRAFAAAARSRDLRLEIIGDGPDRQGAERLAGELGVADRVHFTGYLHHDAVVERMRKATAYVQHFQTGPSGDSEGMPNVIQEAMACGLPIVTTRHAGIPDHVSDGVTGLLVEPGDLEGFAAAIARIDGDRGLRKKLGEAARSYAVGNLDYRVSHGRIEAFMGIGKGAG